jgi:hypothetical protein
VICISQNDSGKAFSPFFAIPRALVVPIVLSYLEGYTTEALERVDKTLLFLFDVHVTVHR